MKKKAVLVTGGAGYVGSCTAYFLAQQGYKVVVLDALLQGQVFCHAWADFFCGDYGDSALLEKIFQLYTIEAVFHFGAFISVSDSMQHPLDYYTNNVSKTTVLLEVMVNHRIKKMIFSSSCATYGIPIAVPITEEHPQHPINTYGTTKLMVEKILTDCARSYDFTYVILRYFNAAGALPAQGLGECHIPEQHSIPLLLHAALTGKPFSIFGLDYPTSDGTCIRDYVHVYDLAQAHILALTHLQKEYPSDAFNIGTGKGHSVKELIKVVERVTHLPVKTIPASRRQGDPAVLVAETTKAKLLLNFTPVYTDVALTIQTAWQFMQAHHQPFERVSKEKSL